MGLTGTYLPRPVGQAPTDRVYHSGRLGEAIIANLLSLTLLTFG
jgi:hypothetical protein